MQQQSAAGGGDHEDRQERLLLREGAEDGHDLCLPQVQGLAGLRTPIIRLQETLQPSWRAHGGHPATRETVHGKQAPLRALLRGAPRVRAAMPPLIGLSFI